MASQPTQPLADRSRLGLLALALLLLSCAGVPPADGGAGERQGDSEAFLVVDCLLPPQIRKLGSHATYATPRRPAKLSAEECAKRGGEYTAPGEANEAAALAVWLTAASQGDSLAQTYVGEIYEKGLGAAEPDFELAALWYRRAAEQGFARAQLNLGQLYDEGHGVNQDAEIALFYYREASGLEEKGLAFLPSAPVADVEGQREALKQRERMIEERSADLETLRAEAERARSESAEQQAMLTKERASLEEERRNLSDQRLDVDAVRRQTQEERARVGDDRKVLEGQEIGLADREAHLAALEQTLGKREQGLRERDVEAAQREAALAARERELEDESSQLARLRKEVERAQAAAVAPADPAAPPQIELIDPPIPQTRDSAEAVTQAEVGERLVVGRVSAPAGLVALIVNGRKAAVGEDGLFEASVSVPQAGLQVTVAAVDRRGRRKARSFRVEAASRKTGALAKTKAPAIPDLEFGRYAALVIGNDRYTKLPSLQTANADARAVAELLESRYGFRVRLLLDASRYQILSALNELRASLTEEDNFLLYYAGHGELDRANLRGHWLPVDAEPDSSANWISNVAISDILNAMSARHVLVVADSCYSGTLTRAALASLDAGMGDESREAWMRAVLAKRSRTALTSGGLQPVLDSGGGAHSVFAQHFLATLEQNRDVLEAQRLYRDVAARVTGMAARARFEQVPQYAPIKFAGHESGDFFFVPGSRVEP